MGRPQVAVVGVVVGAHDGHGGDVSAVDQARVVVGGATHGTLERSDGCSPGTKTVKL